MSDYITTHSGTQVSRTSGRPTFEDIALSLSRQPRFAGMTRRWWSVLDHSLFVAQLVRGGGYDAGTVLAALLHDAHEIMGDIPTPFKTGEQKRLQRMLDVFWWGILPDDVAKIVSDYDKRALLAEALVVGPPVFQSYTDIERHFGFLPLVSDVNVLIHGITNGYMGVNPSELNYGVKASNAAAFILSIRQLSEHTKP